MTLQSSDYLAERRGSESGHEMRWTGTLGAVRNLR